MHGAFGSIIFYERKLGEKQLITRVFILINFCMYFILNIRKQCHSNIKLKKLCTKKFKFGYLNF